MESNLSDKTCSKCHPNFVLHLTTVSNGAEKAASSNSGTWYENDGLHMLKFGKMKRFLWTRKNLFKQKRKASDSSIAQGKKQGEGALNTHNRGSNSSNNKSSISNRSLNNQHTIFPLRTQPSTPPSSFDGQIEYSTARSLKSSPGIQQQKFS